MADRIRIMVVGGVENLKTAFESLKDDSFFNYTVESSTVEFTALGMTKERKTVPGYVGDSKDIFEGLNKDSFFDYTVESSIVEFTSVDSDDFTPKLLKKWVSDQVECDLKDPCVALALEHLRKAFDQAKVPELEAA